MNQKRRMPWNEYGLELSKFLRERESDVVSKPPAARRKPKASVEATT